MLRLRILSILMPGLLAGTTLGEDATKTPTGPSPRLLIVSGIQLAEMTFSTTQTVTKAVPVWEERQVNVQGQVQKIKVVTYKHVYEPVTVMHTLKGVEFQTAGGEKLKREDGLKRLKPGSVVVVAADHNRVDPVYLRMFKSEVLVLSLAPVPTK